MFGSEVPAIQRIKIFILCFIQYTYIHCCRSTWSYVSGQINHSGQYQGFTNTYLGYINFAFLMCYGISIMLIGQIGDRISLKLFVLTGGLCTSLIVCSIGVALHYEQSHRYLFMVLMILNGIAQSTSWPGLLAILNNWNSQEYKVIILGTFAASMNIGDIIGDLYSGQLVGHYKLPLSAPMYASAGSLALISLINAYYLDNQPTVEQVVKQESQSQTLSDHSYIEQLLLSSSESVENNKQQCITVIQAYKLPGVALYAISLGCIKAVFYILLFWLPDYLLNLNVPNIALITRYYTDKRAIIIIPSLWLGTIVMIAINYVGTVQHPVAVYTTMVFFTGLLIGGCYNNIGSAITVELSNQPALKNNKQSTTTVVSAIMGYSAIFAALNQLIIPYVESNLFLYCGGLSIVAGILLIPLIVNESIRQFNKQQNELEL